MSEDTQNEEVAEATPQEEAAEEQTASTQPEELKLNGLFAFKEGMTSVYGDDGETIPVTVLKYEPLVVSQVKTSDKDGYEAIQVSCKPKKAIRTSKSEKNHLAKAGFENGAYVTKEVRQSLPDGVGLGQKVSINSFAAGDKLAITSNSKGRGFSGAMKRHGFGGGPASHGSGFHRRPGSIGNCEFPGRVMPGRKMPGHYGDAKVTVKNVEVVRVLPEESVILVKGPVPGARNNLVKLVRL